MIKPILLTRKQAKEEKRRSRNLGWPYLPAIYEIPPKKKEKVRQAGMVK